MLEIYQRMVSSGLNDVVGGGDPHALGKINSNIIDKLAAIEPGMRVLDFGCGCGRIALPVLERLGSAGSLVGVDILPSMVSFCANEISPHFSNAEFFCLQADNSHYEKWRQQSSDSFQQLETLGDLPAASFDIVFAFSVFTHLNRADTQSYLREIAALLKPNGRAVLSVLFINDSSRMGNRLGLSSVPFGRSIFFKKAAYFGNQKDKLASVGYRESVFTKIAMKAGLDVCQIYYGAWPGRKGRKSYQDMISLQPRPVLPKHFDVARYLVKNPGLPFDASTSEGRRAAVRHYLNHGFFEGREI